MPRKSDKRIDEAKELFLQGMKLIDIAGKLGIPEGTVRSWKNRYKWDCNVANEKKCNVAKQLSKEKPVADEVKQVAANAELTDRQKVFCLLYIKCFNATKAYQKVYGCSEYTAAVNGCRLLKSAKIKAEILALKQERLNQEYISEHDIFQKYMDIAFADITDYVSFGREQVPVMGAFGPVSVEDPETGENIPLLKEVNAIRFKESSEVDGTLIAEVKQGKDGASIKLADRMKALDWLSKHMNMATEEQRARIDLMKSQISSKDDDKPIQISFVKASDADG